MEEETAQELRIKRKEKRSILQTNLNYCFGCQKGCQKGFYLYLKNDSEI